MVSDLVGTVCNVEWKREKQFHKKKIGVTREFHTQDATQMRLVLTMEFAL